jgi:quercetin 2,3-dioxygenase
MANSILHKAETRGDANHGWLHSRHTFSFANYHNPERMHFGAIRVLNDDIVAPGMGFGTHRHDNMEIISIPLEGDLEHKDSMNNVAVIRKGDIQVMSAGTGIAHSEYNKNKDKEVRFLQIWVFPNKENVVPRYDQVSLRESDRHNKLEEIISPQHGSGKVWIHQNAWFYLTKADKDWTTEYELKNKDNGLYVFVLEGKVRVNDQLLDRRDGCGIWNTNSVTISAVAPTELLLMEVPMTI